MQNISFKDWLNAQESSPFTRSRFMAIMGLGPDIPDASLNSHSTAPPWMSEKIEKKKKKRKKKKIDEVAKSPSYSFDDFIKKAEELHKLFDQLGKKKSEDEKKTKEEEKKKPKEDNKKSEPKKISKKETPDNEIFKSKENKPSEDGRISFDVQKKKEISKPKKIEDENN